MGFFNLTEYEYEEPESSFPLCGSCGFFKRCATPKVEPVGKGKKGLLVVMPFPTKSEDAEGKLFTSGLARRLEVELVRVGVDMWEDCWLTYSLICKPNKQPTDWHVKWCRPTLNNTIDTLRPVSMLLLGDFPNRSVIGRLWKEAPGEIGRWAGRTIPSQQLNAWVCPTWSVQNIRTFEEEGNLGPVVWWKRHIEAAVSKTSRPWETVPDYERQVVVENNSEKAAKTLRRLTATGKPLAFDYETTCLQPEGRDSEILTAAVCFGGEDTLAYNWQGEAIEATKEMLLASNPKVLANASFERRWTWEKLGCDINNVVWDTIDAAHWVDNRRNSTSVKYQSFTCLGHPAYDEWIKPYMGASGGYTQNRLREMSRQKLLLYNGLDAILEYFIAKKQMEESGYAPYSL